MLYRVTWIIDLEAESFEEAARNALIIQRDSESIATHFIVTDEKGHRREVDLGIADELVKPKVFVCVPLLDGVVRNVMAFRAEESAQQAEEIWLRENELLDEKYREKASDFGTGIAVWECELKG